MPEHKKEESTICPNCGFPATRNYCAQCGQETHLHKETFIGLVTHFVGHYFHYDSKFWVTLKTLFTKPGMLTVAYWEKKRMRFIPPISLYIFVSIVFFFLFFSTVGADNRISGIEILNAEDSVSVAMRADSMMNVRLSRQETVSAEDSAFVIKRKKMTELLNSSEGSASFFRKIIHAAPKIFFFMIPVMAFILKLLYRKRKDFYFVDHAIFSLHVHAFAFILLLPYLYSLPKMTKNWSWLDQILDIIQAAVPYIGFVYLVLAIRKAYKSAWVSSVGYSLIISTGYVFFFFVVALLYSLFIFVQTVYSL